MCVSVCLLLSSASYVVIYLLLLLLLLLLLFIFFYNNKKLGEHCDWFKHDNYEDSTRIPTIIKPAQGLLGPDALPAGTMIEDMTEEVDIFPSLVDLHGYPVPDWLEGTSWIPLLKKGAAQNKSRVFSQYPHLYAERKKERRRRRRRRKKEK